MPTIDFSAGYRDATKGATLKALQKRQDDQAAATALAMKPREIGSMWQGAAQIGDVISGSIREGRLANQEAAGRARFAELLAGGLAPDEVGEAMGLDPETTMKFQERNWAQEDLKESRATEEMRLLRERGWSVEDAETRVREKIAEEDRAAGREEKIDTREQGQTIATEERAAGRETDINTRELEETKAEEIRKAATDAAKAEQDAALSTPQGERAAAVKAGTMSQAEADELNKIDEDKARADAAAAGPDEWRTPTAEEAARQGGEVGRSPGSYMFNAKTGEFKPVERARTSTDIANTGKFETSLAETRSAKTALKKALELAPNIFEGGGLPGNLNIPGTDIGAPEGTGDALQRAKVVLMTPWAYPDEWVKQAEATKGYFNIMNEEAIKAMGIALTGASSNLEMQEFQKIMADPGTPLTTKQDQIKRMLAKLDAYEQIQTKQVTESGGNTGIGQTAPDASDATTPSEEDIAETMRANNMTREQVIAEFNRRRGGG